MLLVAEKGREHEVFEVFHKWGLDAVTIGIVTETEAAAAGALLTMLYAVLLGTLTRTELVTALLDGSTPALPAMTVVANTAPSAMNAPARTASTKVVGASRLALRMPMFSA